MKTYSIERMGTSGFYCPNCGESGYLGDKYWLEDGWDNIHPSIEYICTYCFDELRA